LKEKEAVKQFFSLLETQLLGWPGAAGAANYAGHFYSYSYQTLYKYQKFIFSKVGRFCLKYFSASTRI